MNSRGCQPTEPRPPRFSTLEGSHNIASFVTSNPCSNLWFTSTKPTEIHQLILDRSRRHGDAPSGRERFSNVYPWVVPTAIQVVHLRRTDAWARGFGFGRWMWAVECWVLDLRCLRFPRSIFWISVEPMRRPEQFRPPVARRDARLPSATRMNMNSRGCQPTEPCSSRFSTLEGSQYIASFVTSNPCFNLWFTSTKPPEIHQLILDRSRRHGGAPSGRTRFSTRLPWVAPTAIHVVRFQRTRPDRLRLEPVPAFVIGPERAVPS